MLKKRLFMVLMVMLAWLISPGEVLAHGDDPLAPHDVWSAWSWEPTILLGLVFSVGMYVNGVRNLWRKAGGGHGVGWRHVIAFALGILFVFAALISPIDALGEVLFSGHMVQHMLLIFFAAPLLAYAAPPVALAWAVPQRWRVRVLSRWTRAPAVRAIGRGLMHPAVVWVLYVAALVAWHIPVLYELALQSTFFHALEHVSFLGTALLLWWTVFYVMRREKGDGFAVLYLFSMVVPGGLLGALITFASDTWYSAHLETTAAWNLTPLADQQLAGVIMWVPAGIVYLAVAMAILGEGLLKQERKDERVILTRE